MYKFWHFNCGLNKRLSCLLHNFIRLEYFIPSVNWIDEICYQYFITNLNQSYIEIKTKRE